MAQITICSCQLWLVWNSDTQEEFRLGFNSPVILNIYETHNRGSWPEWSLKRVGKRSMLKTQVWLLKRSWGGATIFLYSFAPVPPSRTWDICPWEKQMWMSSTSWAAQARARAPPLMTCHVYLACITTTLSFFSFNFPSSHYLSLLLLPFFFLRGRLLREEKPQRELSQIFQEQKKLCRKWSVTSIAPSYLLSLVQHPGGCWMCWIFCGFAVGLEQIKELKPSDPFSLGFNPRFEFKSLGKKNPKVHSKFT